MNPDPAPEAPLLLARAAGGEADAWGALLARHQERLRCVAALRLDPRLRGRVDAADVVQDEFIDVIHRYATTEVQVPLWFVVLLAAPLPVWRALLLRRRRLALHRAARNLCVRCGYDLRATPGPAPSAELCRQAPRPRSYCAFSPPGSSPPCPPAPSRG